MRKYYVLALGGLAFFGLGAAAFLYFSQLKLRSPLAPGRVFELAERPKFLTEELALACARQVLKQDGLDPADWQPVPNGHTHAPDGRVDAYLGRTPGVPNRGVLLFTRRGGSPHFVTVELQGSRVVCQNALGK